MKPLRILLLLLGIALYVVLLVKFDAAQALSLFRRMDWVLLASAVAMVLPEVVFKALRFRVLARPETHLTLGDSTRIYLSGQPMALVTPGKLGDVIRVWLFKRLSRRSTPDCLAVHTSDKIFDFAALVILATIGLLGWSKTPSVLTATGGVCAGLLLAAALMNPGWFKPAVKFFIQQWVPPHRADPLKHHGREFLDKLKHRLSPSTGNFFAAFLFSVAAWESAILRGWLCGAALGLPLTFGHYLLGAPLVVLVELLPISILGFGPREAALILLFASPTLPPGALISFSLLTLLAGPVVTALLGLPSALSMLKENRENPS